MGTVIMHNVVSVVIADQNDDVGPLHEWYFSGDTLISAVDRRFDHSGEGVGFMVSSASTG